MASAVPPAPRWRYERVAEYLEWYRACTAALRAGRRVVISRFGDALDEAAFRRNFLRELDYRINMKAGLCHDGRPVVYRLDRRRGTRRLQGRRWEDLYQTDLMRDQQDLHAILRIRLIVRQFRTDIVRRRFSHLLSEE